MKLKHTSFLAAVTLCASMVLVVPGMAEDRSIIVQSTTSTQNSGLFDYILPMFEKGIRHQGQCGCCRHRTGHQECPQLRR